jgi:hypothetical protein
VSRWVRHELRQVHLQLYVSGRRVEVLWGKVVDNEVVRRWMATCYTVAGLLRSSVTKNKGP